MAVEVPLLVEVAKAVPYDGGLLKVAEKHGWLHDNLDPHLGGGFAFIGSPCGVASLAPGLSDAVLGITPGTEKTFVEPSKYENHSFAIYKGVKLSPAYKDYESEARLGLELGETFGVEQGVRILVLESAVQIGGTPQSITAALALAEQYSAERFGGKGVIHTNRAGAAWLASKRGVIVDENDHTLTTAQGTPIVNGAGYGVNGPGATVPTAGNFFIYVTGPIHLYRGSVIYTQGQDLQTNTETGLAERIYTAENECLSAFIEVNGTL